MTLKFFTSAITFDYLCKTHAPNLSSPGPTYYDRKLPICKLHAAEPWNVLSVQKLEDLGVGMWNANLVGSLYLCFAIDLPALQN